MRLRQLFEEKLNVVAVMPGGFHPFHPGHKSLYDWATKEFGKSNVYVAATNDTSTRPFPFDIKQKLASMAGVPADKFIQIKSPFNALSYTNIIGDPTKNSLVFIRSEKDQGTHPLPDQIRKSDGMPGYLISYKGKEQLQPAEIHAHIAYGPTINFDFSGMQIRSATELRNTWPKMSEEEKHKAAELMYGGGHNEAVKLLDQALGGDTVGEDDGRTIRIPSLTAQPHLAGLEDPDGDYDDSELRVYTKSYRDMYKKAKAAQAKADATGGPGASYQTKARDVTVSKELLPKRTKPKKPRT